LQRLDAIYPVRVTEQGLIQSADSIRARPIPTLTDEDRRTNQDDNARVGFGVDHCTSSNHGTYRNPALHDVLRFASGVWAVGCFATWRPSPSYSWSRPRSMLAANASRSGATERPELQDGGDDSTGGAIGPASRFAASDAYDYSRPQPTSPRRRLCFERNRHSVKTLRVAPAERRSH
jgi:hypothetical protein